MNTRLIAIDGQPLLYRSYYQKVFQGLSTTVSSETEIALLSGPPRTSDGRRSGGFYGFLRSLNALQRQFPGSPILFAFDSGRSWRNDVVESYKHRGTRTPPEGFEEQLMAVQSFLTAMGYPMFIEPQLEADDLLAIMTTRWLNTFVQHTAIIVSSDRDFFQLVSARCLLYDDRQKTFFGPTEVQALTGVIPEQYLDWKCLVGDPADNLLGVLGYGKKKAAKFINEGGLLEFLPLEEVRLAERNHFLMRLPRRVSDLRIARKRQQHLEILVSRVIQRCTTGYPAFQPPVDLHRAQSLLDQYECKSLNLADFGAQIHV